MCEITEPSRQEAAQVTLSYRKLPAASPQLPRSHTAPAGARHHGATAAARETQDGAASGSERRRRKSGSACGGGGLIEAAEGGQRGAHSLARSPTTPTVFSPGGEEGRRGFRRRATTHVNRNTEKWKILRWRRREDDASGSQGKQAPSIIRLVTAAVPTAAALPGAPWAELHQRAAIPADFWRSPLTYSTHVLVRGGERRILGKAACWENQQSLHQE